MKNTLNKISPLPAPTWGWLHINDARVQAQRPAGPYRGDPLRQKPGGVALGASVPALPGAAHPAIGGTGAGQAAAGAAKGAGQPAGAAAAAGSGTASITQANAAWVEANQSHTLRVEIPAGVTPTGPVFLAFHLDKANPALANRLHISLGANASAEIIVLYTADRAAPRFHAGFTTVEAGEGAKLKYTAVQLLQPCDTQADALHATLAQNAHADLLFAGLGGAKAVNTADVHLAGRGASAEISSLYTGKGTAEKDLNYRILFDAPETEGQITARGVLNGQAKKTLKSTIEFATGCSGAKGREEESVLVLSDAVANISAPLLLCGEDNVEGQHATNIGRPDKNKLYYLMSRGFTEAQARRLLVEAQLAPLLEKVGDTGLQRQISLAIQEVVENGD